MVRGGHAGLIMMSLHRIAPYPGNLPYDSLLLLNQTHALIGK
jgi:hypothetical protein